MTHKTMLRFRIWNNRLKIFIKGYKEAKKFFHGFCNDQEDDRNLGCSFWKNSDDYYQILRSTGLKDKKGIEIFEGDIIVISNGQNGVVYFEDGKFNIKGELIGELTPLFQFQRPKIRCEVIGNKFENPELLEAKK